MKKFLAKILLSVTLFLSAFLFFSCKNIFDDDTAYEQTQDENTSDSENLPTAVNPGAPQPQQPRIIPQTKLTGYIFNEGANPQKIEEVLASIEAELASQENSTTDSNRAAFPAVPVVDSTTYSYFASYQDISIAGSPGAVTPIDDALITTDSNGHTVFLITLETGHTWKVTAGLKQVTGGASPETKILLSDEFSFSPTEESPLLSHVFLAKPSIGGYGDVDLKIKLQSGNDVGSITIVDDVTGLPAPFSAVQDATNPLQYNISATNVTSGQYKVRIRFWSGASGSGVQKYCSLQTINVFDNMVTNKWEGVPLAAGSGGGSTTDPQSFQVTNAAIEQAVQTYYYVGTTAMGTAGENGNGSPLEPFDTLQKAVDAIAANGLSTRAYTIFVSGSVKAENSGGATFSTSLNTHAQSILVQGTTGSSTDIISYGADSAGTIIDIQTSVPVSFEKLKIQGGGADACGINISASSTSTVTLGPNSDVNSTASGAGVAVHGGSFVMKGLATVSGNWDIVLDDEKSITLQNFSSSSALSANINMAHWRRGAVIITGTNLNDTIAGKFGMRVSSEDEWTKIISATQTQISIDAPIYVGSTAFVTGLDTNPGTKTAPYASIARACEDIKTAGTEYTINIRGSVNGPQQLPGTAAASTFAAGKVILSGELAGSLINAGQTGTALTIDTTVPVEITNLTICGGALATNGGGINITKGSVTLKDGAVVAGNMAEKGGGIYLDGSDAALFMYGKSRVGDEIAYTATSDELTTTGNTGCANSATSGGGIYNDGGSVYLGYKNASEEEPLTSNETDGYYGVTRNYATDGGGIYHNGGILKIASGNIAYNKGSSSGGGIYFNTDGSLKAGAIKNNNAASGGALYIAASKTVEVTDAISMTANTASGSGGAVYNAGTFTMSKGSIGGATSAEQNTAATSGGAIYQGGTFNMCGSARIYPGSVTESQKINDVYLPSEKTINVTATLTATVPVATISLATWFRGAKILSASAANSALITSEITAAATARKFVLSEGDGDWDRESVTTGTGDAAVCNIVINSPVYVASTAETDATRKGCGKGLSFTDALGTKSKPCSSIADALTMFSNDSSPAVITIDGTLTQGQTISGTIHASQVTIQGYEYVEGGVTKYSGLLDGGDTDGQSMLTVIASSTSFPVIIKNLKITGRRTWGGGIYIDQGTVVLTDGAVVTGNYATYGGGVYINNDGRLLMNGKSLIGDNPKSNTTAIYSSTDSSKYANRATHGGGIYCKGELYIGYTLYGSAIISDTMTSNATDGYFGVCRNYAEQGGGILYSDGTLSIYNGNISNNRSTGYGGALYIGKNGGTIKGGNIKNNAANCGGAIYVSSSKTIDLLGSTPLEISGNYVEATVTSTNSEITKQGGGIYNEGTLTIKGQTKINSNYISLASTASGNVVAGQGGAIYNHGTGTVNITDAEGLTNSIEIKNNYVSITISGESSENNDAYARGGAIYTLGNVNISSAADISGNHATASGSNFDTTDVYSYGGAIYMETKDVTISAAAKFDGNSATAVSAFNAECAVGKGGAFYNVGGTLTMSKGKLGTVSANTATTAGGAIVQNGYFNVSGDAFIKPGSEKSNDVYLPDAYYISVAGAITVNGNTSTNPMKITPELWKRGADAEVIEAGAGLSGGLTDALLARFTTTDPDMGVYLYEGTGILEGDIYIAKEEAQTIDGVSYGAGASVSLGGRGTRAKPYSTLDTALDQCWNGPKDTVVTDEGVVVGRTVYVIGEVTGAQSILDAFTTDEASAILLKGATTGAKLNGGFDSTTKGTTLIIATEVPVTIQNLTITGGYQGDSTTTGGGMSIAIGATVKLADGAVVTGNTARYGGGINNQGTLYIYGTARIGGTGDSIATTTSGNVSETGGGGIYNTGNVYLGYSAFTDLEHCTEETTTGGITRNYSKMMGGGVYNEGTFYMSSGSISNNKAYKSSNGGYGGGLYTQGTSTSGGAMLYGGEMKGNTASSTDKYSPGGGAIYLGSGTLKLGLGISIPGNGTRNSNDISVSDSSKITLDRGNLTGAGTIWITGSELRFYANYPVFTALQETTSGLIAENYMRFGVVSYTFTSGSNTYGPGWTLTNTGEVAEANIITNGNYTSFVPEAGKVYKFVIDPAMTAADVKAFISKMTCSKDGYNTSGIQIGSNSILDLSKTSLTSLSVEGSGSQQVVQTFATVILSPQMNANSFNSLSNNYAFASVKNYVVPANSTALCAVDGVVYNKDKTILVKYPSAHTRTSYTIPYDTVTKIGPAAFYKISKLETIGLNNVTEFSNYSFEHGSSLKSITIPAAMTIIPNECFTDCENLQTVTFAGNSCVTLDVNAFFGCKKLKTITLPGSLTTINNQVFYQAFTEYNVTLNIPEDVTRIGKNAFSGCTKLTLTFANISGWQYSSDNGSTWNDIPESGMSETSFFTTANRQFRRQ